jgi:hypothetical protein
VYDSGVNLGLIHEKQKPKILCYCPFKILSITKKTPGGKKDLISSYSMAKNMPKIAEVMLSSCELKDFRKNCDCGIAELQLQSKISLKVAELRLRKCDCGLKKKLHVPTSANLDITSNSLRKHLRCDVSQKEG